MSLVMLFRCLDREEYGIGDESTNVTLPELGKGDSLLLSVSTEMALSLNMHSRVVFGAAGVVGLRRRCLFTSLPHDLERQWLENSGSRPLHPHERQIMELKGVLPEVVTGQLAQAWMEALQLRARTGQSMSGTLYAQRGFVELAEWFGAVPVGQNTEHEFHH